MCISYCRQAAVHCYSLLWRSVQMHFLRYHAGLLDVVSVCSLYQDIAFQVQHIQGSASTRHTATALSRDDRRSTNTPRSGEDLARFCQKIAPTGFDQ